MRRERKHHSMEKLVKFQSLAIRSWREEAMTISDKVFKASESNMRRSLRQERALCGRNGYDLNRHIRLLHQRKMSAVK